MRLCDIRKMVLNLGVERFGFLRLVLLLVGCFLGKLLDFFEVVF